MDRGLLRELRHSSCHSSTVAPFLQMVIEQLQAASIARPQLSISSKNRPGSTSVEDNNVDTDQSIIPIFLGLFIVPAQAQWLGPTWETNIVLTQLDLDMIHAAVTQQIHGKAVGTTASWSNPASYNWGSIRLVKKLALRDQQCEELEYTMRTARPEIYSEHYHFTSCLQPDGTWKIA